MNTIENCFEIEFQEAAELEREQKAHRAWTWMEDIQDELYKLRQKPRSHQIDIRIDALENDMIYARRRYKQYR